MIMKIFVESRDFKREVQFDGKTLEELYKHLELASNDYVAVREGTLITSDEKLSNNDKIKLYPVVSGG